MLSLITTLVINGCNREPPPNTGAKLETNPEVESFTVRNTEIRQDIINELIARNIEYWINEDDSIGFNSKDAKQIDAIGFEAIGAYAARN
tara:strand:- start:342 stop:611 length:270 start_codon:yes stop_codon:yes gene_type:complete